MPCRVFVWSLFVVLVQKLEKHHWNDTEVRTASSTHLDHQWFRLQMSLNQTEAFPRSQLTVKFKEKSLTKALTKSSFWYLTSNKEEKQKSCFRRIPTASYVALKPHRLLRECSQNKTKEISSTEDKSHLFRTKTPVSQSLALILQVGL